MAGGGGFLIPLNEKISARYIKLTLSDKNYLHFNKIQIFKRKFKGLMVAIREDGLGTRLNNLLCAMYLARKSGLKFGFVWNKLGRDNSTPADISAPLASGEEDIFDSKFISEYSYTKTIAFKYPQVKIQRPFSEFVKKPFDYPYGYKCANMAQTLNESGLDMQRFLEVAPSLWEEIKFSKRYEAIKQRAAEVESQICAIPQGPAHAVSGTRSGGSRGFIPLS